MGKRREAEMGGAYGNCLGMVKDIVSDKERFGGIQKKWMRKPGRNRTEDGHHLLEKEIRGEKCRIINRDGEFRKGEAAISRFGSKAGFHRVIRGCVSEGGKTRASLKLLTRASASKRPSSSIQNSKKSGIRGERTFNAMSSTKERKAKKLNSRLKRGGTKKKERYSGTLHLQRKGGNLQVPLPIKKPRVSLSKNNKRGESIYE